MHVSENEKIGKKDLRSPEKYCILRSHRDWKRSEMHTKSSGVATSFVDFAAFFLPLAVRSASGRKDIPYAFPIMKKNMYAGTYNNQKHNFTKRRKSMPKNKRESLIYTVLMCFTMVLWMSIYNVTLHMGALNPVSYTHLTLLTTSRV